MTTGWTLGGAVAGAGWLAALAGRDRGENAAPSSLDRARAPHGAPDELRALAAHADRDVREAVAANPATPRDAIDALLDGLEAVDEVAERQDLVGAVLVNPSVPLWLLDDPGWLGRHGFDALIELARSPALTPLSWQALSLHGSEWVRGPLLASPAAPPDAWRRLGYPSELDALLERASNQVHRPDAMQATVAALVDHPELPDMLHRDPAWLEQKRFRVARLLARSPALTIALWRALRGHPDAGTRLSLLRSPAAPPDAWEQLGFPDGGEWSLTGAPLDADAIEALAAAPPLAAITGLILSGNDLSDGGLLPLLRSPFVGGLGRLDLSDTSLGARGLEALSGATSLRSLTRLGVGLDELGEVDPELVARLARFDGLVSLDLSSNGLRDEHVVALVRARGLDALRELELDGNALTGACMGPLGRWLSRRQLAWLGLSSVQLDDAGLDALVRSVTPSSIRRLELGSNRLTDGIVPLLERLDTALPRLTLLDLSGNPLGDASARALAASPCLATLTSLDLTRCEGLTDAGRNTLREAAARHPRLRLSL